MKTNKHASSPSVSKWLTLAAPAAGFFVATGVLLEKVDDQAKEIAELKRINHTDVEPIARSQDVRGRPPLLEEAVPPPERGSSTEALDAGCSKLPRITTPENGAKVASADVMVTGCRPGDLKEDLYIFVLPERAPGKAWPQSPDAATGAPAHTQGAQWTVPVTLGGPPQNYDLVLMAASKSASAFIGDTLRRWHRAQDFPGLRLTNLPAGLTEKHRIHVAKQSPVASR